MTEFRLPWPDKRLNPNSREHWSKVGSAKSEAKTAAWAICREAGLRNWDGPAHLSLKFCPPDRRGRDMDNAFASMKAAIDGISTALGVDDKHFTFSMGWGDRIPGGAVDVTVSQHEQAAVNIPFRGVIR